MSEKAEPSKNRMVYKSREFVTSTKFEIHITTVGQLAEPGELPTG